MPEPERGERTTEELVGGALAYAQDGMGAKILDHEYTKELQRRIALYEELRAAVEAFISRGPGKSIHLWEAVRLAHEKITWPPAAKGEGK